MVIQLKLRIFQILTVLAPLRRVIPVITLKI